MHFVCVVELHVTVNCIANNNECCTTILLWQIYVSYKNNTCVVLTCKVSDAALRSTKLAY